jgi:hypothetical protein
MMQFTKDSKIWVDMDGVLADFDAWVWGQLEKSTTTDGLMWKWLQRQDRAYYRFLPMKDAKQLWDYVNQLAPGRVAILTGLPFKNSMPEVEQDKKDWFTKYPDIFGVGAPVDFNVGPYARDKYKHCRPGDILIDDNARNIVQWTNAGGFGVFHSSFEQTKEVVDAYLKECDTRVKDATNLEKL